MKPTPVLKPLGFLYGFGMQLRNRLYDCGIFHTHRLEIPVISIGNINAGGTGKSPVTMWLAAWLRQNGHQPAVLSRGYGRKSRGYRLVHDGKRLLLNPEIAGDEPVMIARRLENVPVAVCEDRVAGGRRLLEQVEATVLILDDAFQHRRLHRDVDIVLIDAANNPLHDRCLPGGWLREPVGGLRRANLILLTKGSEAQKTHIAGELQRFSVPVGKMAVHSVDVVEYSSGRPVLPDRFHQAPVLLVSGVAQPQDVLNSCRNMGISPVESRFYRDHHPFSMTDIKQWLEICRQKHAPAIVTTEKDLVKIAPIWPSSEHPPVHLWVLKQQWQPETETVAMLERQILGLFK